jgi:hypothetical protein
MGGMSDHVIKVDACDDDDDYTNDDVGWTDESYNAMTE